jgi:putative transposase
VNRKRVGQLYRLEGLQLRMRVRRREEQDPAPRLRLRSHGTARVVGSGYCAGYPGGESTVSSAAGPRSVESPESVTGGGDPDVGLSKALSLVWMWDGVWEPRSILVAHETELQLRALETWTYRQSMSSTVFGPAN